MREKWVKHLRVCVAVSLHHTHPSLPSFATWPVNYLFLFTHAHKENKPLSDCLDRLHSPSTPFPPPTPLLLSLSSFLCLSLSISLCLSSVDQGCLRRPSPRSIKLSSALAGVRVLGGPAGLDSPVEE